MPLSSASLRKYRKRFLWAFVVSFVLLVLSGAWLLSFTAGTPANHPPPPSGGGGGGGRGSNLDLTLFISLASLATSAASFVGFLLTSGLAWRKEKRESQHSEVELEKKRLEVEKLRLEVAAKQSESAKVKQ